MKTIKILALFGLLSSFANAATVLVSSGLSTQGYTVLVNSVAPTSFSWSVGSFDSITSTYVQFGLAQADSAKVNGSVTATGPASLNGKSIDLFVGTGIDIASSGTSWVILRSNTALFPADVSVAGNTTFPATVTNGVSIIARGDAANGFTTTPAATGGNLNLNAIPEPSVALLGAIGVLGLLRRRRI